MKDKEKTENKFINKMKNDYVFRTFALSVLSLFVTVAFTGYNVFLAVVYKSSWNLSISVYYALLLCIRACVIFAEYKFYKAGFSDTRKQSGRKKLFLSQSLLLFIIDLALIAPITMMATEQKAVDYSEIPAITIAAYTVYKIVSATVNYFKTRSGNHLSVRILRNVNFIDALVSLLSLQYTLIMTFGGGFDGDMRILCAVSSFAVWALIIVISVITLIRAVRIEKITGDRNVSD